MLAEVAEFLDSITTLVTGDEIKIDIDDREEAGYLIDSAVYRLDESFGPLLTALRRERNSVVSAACLPTNILIKILLYNGAWDVFLATQVCHTWRRAALSHPPLWSRINMKSKNYSSGLARIQLEHSGSHPLDITFSLIDQGGQIVNQNLPAQPLALIEKASSIANLSTRTIPAMWTNDLPLLNSLHLVVDPSTTTSNYILAPSNLRHYSVDFQQQKLSFPRTIFANLKTLHLRMIPEPASKVLAIVFSSNDLRELVLDTCKNREDLAIGQIDSTVRFPSLELLYLKEVAPPFLSCFLRSEVISETTNLRIEPRQPTPFQRPTPASSVWIDLDRNYVLFEHGAGAGVTYVKLSDVYALGPLYNVSSLVIFQHVTTLQWMGAHIKNPPFRWLPSLISLTFECYPSDQHIQQQYLRDVAGSHLVSLCTHLKYLGILIYEPTENTYSNPEDRPEVEFPRFLRRWRDVHGEVFSEVEIYDKYRPGRWAQMLGTFQDLTGRFEIKNHPFMDSARFPRFPDTRRFAVEEEGESRPAAKMKFKPTIWSA
ncbi:hypothetical protein M408DRAFT_30428 [Serendipita vermifera MAFF 305830]|uniref:F-box domain-containing protein n=1 Tax=Serendipita vermifera MAFF 305830 TaxID=933852 RepID=A0A0C3AJW0_SERVB|nr:hypothetical protein M408DRAFT_30428 [Serendipita vermifera MAFF 305830]